MDTIDIEETGSFGLVEDELVESQLVGPIGQVWLMIIATVLFMVFCIYEYVTQGSGF